MGRVKEVVLQVGFLLKLIAFVIILPIIPWWFLFLSDLPGEKKKNPLPGIVYRGEWVWIGFTVPAFLVILPVTLVIYFFEKPGPWYHRLIFASGMVFFLTTGVLVFSTFYAGVTSDNADWWEAVVNVYFHPVFFGLICIIVAILFFVDALENEGVLEFIVGYFRKHSE